MALQSPRVRQELERSAPLQVAFHIPVTPVTMAGVTLITAQADEDFRVDALWAAEIAGTGTVVVSLYVLPAGVATASDAYARLKGAVIASNDERIICGGTKPPLRLQPGASLVAVSSADGEVNMGGWGFSVAGGET